MKLRKRKPIEERFWPKVDKSAGPEGCWLWIGSRQSRGYGQLAAPGGHNFPPLLAHRLSCEWAHGPSTQDVLHSCDNPPCINPAHLSWGTAKDNARDMVARGRNKNGDYWKKAGRTPTQKLDADDVRVIRACSEAGETARALASLFSITATNVRYIVNRHTWRNV